MTLKSLGFLRLGLLALALVNTLIPLLDLMLRGDNPAPGWEIVPGIINPVMAPLFMVVLIFDIVMSKVRAADAQDDAGRSFFRSIVRVETAVILITLLFWVPFFYSLGGR